MSTFPILEQQLKDSKTPLADIKQLLSSRHASYQATQVKLVPLVFFGKLVSNEFGSVSLINKIFSEYIPSTINTPIIKYEDFFKHLKSHVNFEYLSQAFINHERMPTEHTPCKHCGKAFSIQELDTVQFLDNDEYSHLTCYIEDLDAEHRYKFTEAFVKAGFKVFGLTRTDNLYGSLNYRGHWFVVDTDLGNVTIGYRKRVIDVKFAKNIFIDDGKDTTTYGGGFHAYTEIELVKRLSLLNTELSSIVNM